ncbi:hypothetical protein PQX77_020887 [Marasmius sp. AFHP31]|nr:hypothetical protein PQX77_020887 [Marasmius sp. AFHP31]
MPPVETIEDHFCNLLFKLFKHWPYYKDYSSKLPRHRLITHIPLNHGQEALWGLLLQHTFLSQHISLYWGFIACFDIRQAPIYFHQDLLSNNVFYGAQGIVDMVSEAIAQVGFLHSHTVFLPGAVNAWIDSVISCTEDPPPLKLEPQHLFFFEYHLLMGCWVTHSFYHYNPVLHEEFYLDKLNQADSPSIWDYQREDSKLDNYFRWDKVTVNNMWELVSPTARSALLWLRSRTERSLPLSGAAEVMWLCSRAAQAAFF